MKRVLPAILSALFAGMCFGQSAAQVFESELEALRPTEPVRYYELAEEIADAARSPEDRDLARRLFALAFVLGEATRTCGLRPSACVALASLDPDASRRRWLLAVAALIDDRYAAISVQGDALTDFPEATRFAFAEFLGLVRAGRGALARQRLERPDMEDLLARVGDAVVSGRTAPSLARMRSEAGVWPCKQCSNTRSVPDPADPETERILCPNCGGNPGPRLSRDALIGYVALEAIALRADGQTWSAEHAMLRTGPLRDPDLDRIPEMFGVDPALSVYKSGRWSSRTLRLSNITEPKDPRWKPPAEARDHV